jgi:hypothetical protein
MQTVQRPALTGPLHVIAHALLVAAGWLLFAGFWWLVLRQGPHDLSNIGWLFGGTLVLLPLTTLYWVLHNRRIYARKGPRRQVRPTESGYTRDWTGRPVQARFTELRKALRIEIDSASGSKCFVSLDPTRRAA